MRAVKFLAICGNGMGSSLLVKMNLEDILNELDIFGIVECCALSQAAGLVKNFDIILTSTAFIKGCEDILPKDKKVIILKNLFNKKELVTELRKILQPDVV